jgi:cytochrome c oxidase subunit 4
MMHTHDNHSHDSYDHESTHGTAKYWAVAGGLLVLTMISFWLGNSAIKQTAPQVAWAGMMAVSCGKALLVMLFFMHLLWEANWKYVLTIPASVMSVFLVLMLVPDIGNRTSHYHPLRWLHASEPTAEHGHAKSVSGEHTHPIGEKAQPVTEPHGE